MCPCVYIRLTWWSGLCWSTSLFQVSSLSGIPIFASGNYSICHYNRRASGWPVLKYSRRVLANLCNLINLNYLIFKCPCCLILRQSSCYMLSMFFLFCSSPFRKWAFRLRKEEYQWQANFPHQLLKITEASWNARWGKQMEAKINAALWLHADSKIKACQLKSPMQTAVEVF